MTDVLQITTDGIYTFKEQNWDNDDVIGFGTITNGTSITSEFTFEILPEYPDALVFDGVDDYTSNFLIPENQGTFIYVITAFEDTSYSRISSNDNFKNSFASRGGSIIINWNEDVSKSYIIRASLHSKSIAFVTYDNSKPKITISSNISYNNLNGEIKTNDNIIESKEYSFGTSKSKSAFAFYSAYLFDRSLDEQEIKSFIRKYIDPEYLLPSEIPTPDCYYDFSQGSNDDKTRDTIKDLSGNGNDAVAHNFAWSGMSGYGGYIFRNGNINIKNVTNTNNILYRDTVEGTKIVLHITNIPEGAKVISRALKGIHFEASTDGTYIIENTGTVATIAVTDFVGECNIQIVEEPQYPGALVFDGVDDYVRLDAFDNGFKTVFMVCNPFNLGKMLYDQRYYPHTNNAWYFAIYNDNSRAYVSRNSNATNIINGILNDNSKNIQSSSLIDKKHLITIVSPKVTTVNSITPFIGNATSPGFSYACDMALYKFLGFKVELTEEQINAIIKKYNLLDGVDEIEVS